jgi:serine phosphatase RsbU (regulator of sigma subunit)
VKVEQACRPRSGETVCGDCSRSWDSGSRLVIALADGLGHGREAALAADAALDCVGRHLHGDCAEVFDECDRALRGTRGAALAVAMIDLEAGLLTIGTVGNIRALLLTTPRHLRLDGARGIVGAGFNHLAPITRSLAPGDILVLFSDGLDEFLDPRELSDAERTAAGGSAQAILARWSRGQDDESVVVYRHGA